MKDLMHGIAVYNYCVVEAALLQLSIIISVRIRFRLEIGIESFLNVSHPKD